MSNVDTLLAERAKLDEKIAQAKMDADALNKAFVRDNWYSTKHYLHDDKESMWDLKNSLIKSGVEEDLAEKISWFFYEVEFSIDIWPDGEYSITI